MRSHITLHSPTHLIDRRKMNELSKTVFILTFSLLASSGCCVQKTITLQNGAQMPVLGLGTWQSTKQTAKDAIKTALDVGYRLIDTAFLYNNEADVGEALDDYFKSGKLKRSDVFITTKLSYTAHRKEDVGKMLNESLKALRLDYVDLYLVHTPTPMKHNAGSWEPKKDSEVKSIPDLVDHLDTWKEMEGAFKRGQAKAIGLSNFNSTQIQRVYDHATIKPHHVQVETHVHWPQYDLQNFLQTLNISQTAYAPLGSPGRPVGKEWPRGATAPLTDPVVRKIAAKHKKTPAQILLRWLIQRGINVIPKSSNLKHIKENFEALNFQLDEGDMAALDGIKTRLRLFQFPFFAHHPFFPFRDVQRHSSRTL